MDRTRPILPEGYGLTPGQENMLDWSQVDRCLAEARIYWLATASAGGDPHATPIWGAWVEGAVHFDGYYERTRWGRNLAENPRIVVHIESGSLAIMLKGIARITNPEPPTAALLLEQFATKYNYRPETIEGIYAVRPRIAFAWDNENFATTATRWTFAAD